MYVRIPCYTRPFKGVSKNLEKIGKELKVNVPNTPLGYFWYVIKPFKWWAFGAVFFVILASFLAQASVFVFKLIVEAVERGDKDMALYYALSYPVVLLVIQSLYRVTGFVGMRLVNGAKKRSYDTLSAYLLNHSHSYFINRFAGSLMSKINNVTGAVEHLLPEILWTYITTFVSFVVTLGFIAKADWLSGGLFFLAVIFLIFINQLLSPKKIKYAKENAEANTAFRGRLVDVITNVQAVRQFTKIDKEHRNISALTKDVLVAGEKSWGYSEKIMAINSLLMFVFSSAMFYLLVEKWKMDLLSTGDMVFLLALYSRVVTDLLFIGRSFNRTAQAVGEMREGLEEILVSFEVVDAPKAKPLALTEAEVVWDKVDFDFDGRTVFKQFNLTVPAGQRLGLVGQSGAGKSTFVSLLLRQHDLMSGVIAVGGQDIAKVTQDSLREAIAVVPQEPLLFHRTIKDNILYGRPEATLEEVIEVAKKARAHDFISELTDGYDTMVGERGVKLSGGQKQRVAIARAMLKDAPILVLDEATSALDSESEVEIQKALETLMEGRTVIAIAHRLSTLRKMDRIIVLEQGKIIEDGTHENLSQNGGVYQRLWEHQAGGFLVE